MNYHIVSLGCPKNLVDSEIMMRRMEERGHVRVDAAGDAEIIVVNTCAFIRPAKEESIETILELARQKKTGRCRLLVVTGCLPQRYRRELPEEMPEVDVWVGTDEFVHLPDIVARSLQGEHVEAFSEKRIDYEEALERSLATPRHWAYLKVSEGCDHACRFCVIPAIRGRYRSRSMESVVREATVLGAGGARELVLIAQDITDYGRDLYQRRALPELLDRLGEVPGIEWLRVMYAYPTSVDDRLIEVMARNRKVCRYLDIPLQHASANVLRAMGRPGDAASYLALIKRFRDAVPGIAVRTSFIVGHPGETEADFEALLRFVEEVRFDRVGVFEYSKEEDTPSADLPGRVARTVRQRRFKKLYRVQQRISHELNTARVGQTVRVLVDSEIRHGSQRLPGASGAPDLAVPEAGIGRPLVKSPAKARYLGRTEADAPEIDGTIFLSGGEAVPGEFRQVRITGAYPYDLAGILEPGPTARTLVGSGASMAAHASDDPRQEED